MDKTNSNVFSKQDLETIYNMVFRDSTSQPGFYYKDFGDQIDSKTFRQYMVELKNGLSDLCRLRMSKQLNYQSIGRFNHQHSSKPHRDSAEDLSFLMLGYEPTRVDSQVYLSDYTRYIEDQNISLEDYFGGDREANLVINNNLPDSYVTELTPFQKGNYRLLLLNNSKSFESASFGVFHGAEVTQTVHKEDRLLNYIMMQVCDLDIEDQYGYQAVLDFMDTDGVNG